MSLSCSHSVFLSQSCKFSLVVRSYFVPTLYQKITLFHVTGSLLYCDPNGNVVGAEDVFTKLELAKKHYEKVGLGEDFVQQFVR